MWKVQIKNKEPGVADVTAVFSDEVAATLTDAAIPATTVFVWSATIKTADTNTFVQTAKDELAKYQDDHKDDDTLKSSIETELNK